MTTSRAGLARLRAAAADGQLAAMCQRHGIMLVTVFGSVLTDKPAPRDLDIAVLFLPNATPDLLVVIDELSVLCDTEDVDVMHLNRAGVVARHNALSKGEPLYQSPPGTFARNQMAAATLFLDTEHFRKLDIELMAEGFVLR